LGYHTHLVGVPKQRQLQRLCEKLFPVASTGKGIGVQPVEMKKPKSQALTNSLGCQIATQAYFEKIHQPKPLPLKPSCSAKPFRLILDRKAETDESNHHDCRYVG
jgi:hypothetical protein